METSDHWPCIIEIGTKNPRGRIFKFEKHWLDREDFIPILLLDWSLEQENLDPAKAITVKFKNLKGRRGQESAKL